jgi:hypothetical protein
MHLTSTRLSRKIWLELASKQNEDLEVFTEGKKKNIKYGIGIG